MEGLKIYLAGPISGESYENVTEKIRMIRHHLEGVGYKVMHPMTGKGNLRTEIKFKSVGYDGIPASSNHAIYERDKWMVRNADVVLFHLANTARVSIGSMFELAWAALEDKHTIVVMENDNIHEHAFVFEAADIIFPNLQSALGYLEILAKEEQ